MSNIYTMDPGDMRKLLLTIKAMVDSNGRPVDIVGEIQGILNGDVALKHDPYPFPDEAPNPRQMKLII
jgi:hypothetical protein